MAIPYQTEVIIQCDGFSPNHRCESAYTDGDLNSIYYGNTIALLVPVRGEKFFVPTIAHNRIIEKIDKEKSPTPEIDKTYIIPITVASCDSRRTSPAIIKSLLHCSSNSLRKIRTSSSTYIGSTGLIMENDFTPLMMWGCMGNIMDSPKLFEFNSPTVYVNPKLFSNTDALSKYLVKSILPSLVQGRCCMSACRGSILSSRLRYSRDSQKPKVIIEDFSHMFYRPLPPVSIQYSEQINARIADDYRRILQRLD